MPENVVKIGALWWRRAIPVSEYRAWCGRVGVTQSWGILRTERPPRPGEPGYEDPEVAEREEELELREEALELRVEELEAEVRRLRGEQGDG